MGDFIFIVLAILLIISTLGVCISKNLVHAAVCLFFSLFIIAGFYIILYADFLAAVQVIVYVGGILVLIIFGVMLTNKLEKPSINISSMNQFLASTLCTTLFILFTFTIYNTNWKISNTAEIQDSSAIIGRLILNEYLLQFEIVSILLLGALIGAATIARKKR